MLRSGSEGGIGETTDKAGAILWKQDRGSKDENIIKSRSMPQVKNLRVAGRIGPVIFYFVGDKFYSRAAPGKIKQAPKTKIRSANFGIAAKAGKALRGGLAEALLNTKDRQMQSRFSGGIAKWLALQSVKKVPPEEDIPGLYRFQFGGLWAFEDVFHVPFTVSMKTAEGIEIHIPSFIPTEAMKGPRDTLSVDCTFAVAECDLATGMPMGNNLVRWNIPYNNATVAAQTFTLPCPQPAGSLIVVTAGLSFSVLKNGVPFVSDNPSYITCSVLKSWYL